MLESFPPKPGGQGVGVRENHRQVNLKVLTKGPCPVRVDITLLCLVDDTQIVK